MRITITIHDDVDLSEDYVTSAVSQTISHWKNYEGQWSPGAAIVYQRLGIATCTKKTDAGWVVRVYNLNSEVE
jgi:hypothetical protein